MPGPWVWNLEHVYESINYIIILKAANILNSLYHKVINT